MVAKTFIKQEGTWNQVGGILVKQNDEWTDIKSAWVKQAGQWIQVFGPVVPVPGQDPIVPAPPADPPRSVLFEASKEQALGTTFSDPINPIKWTFSSWVKRGITGTTQTVFCGGLEGTGPTQDSVDIKFTSGNQIEISAQIDDVIIWQMITNEVFVDPTQWYNIVISYDSANPTQSERLKMHVNGISVTVFSVNNPPALNEPALINLARPVFYGKLVNDGVDTQFLDGYMAESIFVDGEALLPTSFGRFTAWLWRQIDFVEAFGINGHYLDFKTNQITNITATAGDVGTDPLSSPNNAKDENPSTTFQTNITPADDQVILNYDLGSAETITQTHVIGYHQIANASNVSFRVEFSSDDFVGDINVFDTFQTVSPGNIPQDFILNDSATARFWRIVANQNHNQPVEITAFKLFNSFDLGNDKSTNTNNFGTNQNITSNDQTFDHPLANHVTYNPDNKSANSILERGRLNISSITPAPANAHGAIGTIGINNGKWYYEVSRIVVGSTGRSARVGFAEFDTDLDNVSIDLTKVFLYGEDGFKSGNGATTAYGATWGGSSGPNDTIGIALDLDNGTIEFFKNGVSQGIAFNTGILGKTLYPVTIISNGGGATASKSTWEMDPGTFGFRYSIPSGFKAITVQNIGKLDNSILFNETASPSLFRTQGLPTAETKWTFSTWFKRGNTTSTNMALLGSSIQQDSIRLQTDKIQVNFNNGFVIRTTPIFIDITAWYHVVVRWDGLNPITNQKLRIYVNGFEIDDYEVDQRASITANGFEGKFNKSGETVFVGSTNGTSEFFDGYMAEVTFVDGQSLPPESFGFIDPVSGVWSGEEFVISNPGPLIDETAGGEIGTITSNASSPAINAIDDDLSTNINRFTSTMFASFDFGAANEKIITSYSVTAVDSIAFTSASVANSWTLLASNTGAFAGEEVILDTVTGQTWTPSQKKVFTINNVTEFRHYRLNITANASGTDVRIGEWELLSTTTIPGAITSFGNNGFYLRFHDKDRLGINTIVIGNEFNHTNLDPIDVTKDSPFANYAVFSPLHRGAGTPGVLTNGNLNFEISGSNVNAKRIGCTHSLPVNKKIYWEIEFGAVTPADAFWIAGVTPIDVDIESTTDGGSESNEVAIQINPLTVVQRSGVNVLTGISLPNDTDIIGFAVDTTISPYKLWISVNGVFLNSGDPEAGTNEITTLVDTSTYMPFLHPRTETSPNTLTSFKSNFGQRPFKFVVPGGFVKLSTINLSDSPVLNASESFNAILYTGNGSTQFIDIGFTPDFIWNKSRNQNFDNILFDTSRGSTEQLISNTNATETTIAQSLISFDTDGFTIGNDALINSNADTFVSWNWKEDVDSGFDIITYTGNSTAGRLLTHTLGKTPEMMIVKSRTSVNNWFVWHKSFPGISSTDYLMFDLAIILGGNGPFDIWDNTLPDATNIVLGADPGSNNTGEDYVLYAWTSIEGFSKFGSYTGNGDADGPFIHCGFKPAFVLSKRVNGNGDWTLYDNAIHPYNRIDTYLEPNNNQIETSTVGFEIDFLANGFKIRGDDVSVNAIGEDYIFAAFAETSFKTATSR